jgi:Replication-relaxation
MVGTNWFFVALAACARHGGGELRAWLNETEAAGYYQYRLWGRYSGRSLPHPDGIGTWAEHGQEITFFLEYDTGSENLPRLAESSEPALTWPGLAAAEVICPPLLFCFPGPRREQASRRALASSRDAADLRIATAALDPQP